MIQKIDSEKLKALLFLHEHMYDKDCNTDEGCSCGFVKGSDRDLNLIMKRRHLAEEAMEEGRVLYSAPDSSYDHPEHLSGVIKKAFENGELT